MRRHITFSVKGAAFDLISDTGVFSKDELDEGTRILLEAGLTTKWEGLVGDIGCAIGTVGIVLASLSKTSSIYLVDVNQRAVDLAIENADNLQLSNVQISTHDGITHWPNEFDSLWLNPPIRAGKSVMYRLYQEAYDHLKEGGSLLVVIRKAHGAESTFNELKSRFRTVERIYREKGYHVYQATR